MDYNEFKRLAGDLSGIDLSNYKSQQMDRRINSLMQYWGLKTYDEYLELLKTDPKKNKEFINRLTINVSEFFRNSDRFQILQKQIIPELLSKNQFLRIWSAGCSNGSEPYSVAIILKELQAEHKAKIIATDVDREILAKAAQATYIQSEVKNLPDGTLEKYFDSEKDKFKLKSTITSLVDFRYQNLLTDTFEKDFNLIICRNVVIYFTDAAKNELYQKFLESLKPGGYLLVGGTEPILNYRQMGFEAGPASFYRKPGGNGS